MTDSFFELDTLCDWPSASVGYRHSPADTPRCKWCGKSPPKDESLGLKKETIDSSDDLKEIESRSFAPSSKTLAGSTMPRRLRKATRPPPRGASAPASEQTLGAKAHLA